MSTQTGKTSVSSRIHEEIQIFNLSLPMEVISSKDNEAYEPELLDLIKAVECPVCRCIPSPPIYNCVNGHFSCSLCRPRLPLHRCAYCLGKLTKMRNYPLENLVTTRAFTCDFRHSGCKIRDMTMMEYEEHMKNCWFRSLALPSNQPEKHKKSQQQSFTLPQNEFSCPRCNFMNSKRKLKCQNCQVNLRVPTPMCSRPPWVESQKDCSTDYL